MATTYTTNPREVVPVTTTTPPTDPKVNPNAPVGPRAKKEPTPLAPWPGTRMSGDPNDPEANPYEVPPTPREGEDNIPPVMITQDVSSPGRTISTMYDPKDQMEPIPPGGPGGGTGTGTPSTDTVTVSSSDLLALNTTPKTLVTPDPGESLEFTGATAQFTFGTTPYTGTGILHIKCGTLTVSNDVPATFLTGSANGTANFTPVGTFTPTADQPLTLSLNGGPLAGGDGTLSLNVNSSSHAPEADPTKTQPPTTSTAKAAPSVTLSKTYGGQSRQR